MKKLRNLENNGLELKLTSKKLILIHKTKKI
jgi:hypothetical protein